MLKQSKFSNDPKGAESFVTLERFILTHMASLNNIEDKYTIEEAKRHFSFLNELGVKQVALIIPEPLLKDKIMSTLNYRNEKWKEYLYSKGNEKDILEYYNNWQNKFLYYIDKFKDVIETSVIEVKNDDYAAYGNVILDKFFKEKNKIRFNFC